MIHTFEISYGLSLKDANTCAYRLNELTQAYKDKGYLISNFLDIERKSGRLEFTVPELMGIQNIRLSKFEDRSGYINFRICFMIEAEILRTGIDTLDLFFCSSEHAKELQTQYARAIYKLFPEAFTGRSAPLLYHSGFAPMETYTEDEFNHGGLFALPYLPLASVRRLDMTFDLVSEDEDHARLLTEMVQKSYYDGHKKIEMEGVSKNPENSLCYDKVYKSGSRSFSVYYKHDKMFDEAYKDRPNIKPIQELSKNVTRVEMSYTSQNRGNVKSLTWLQVPDGELTLGPLSYLANEQVSFSVFNKEFFDRVGYHPVKLKWFKLRELYKQVNKLVRDRKIKKIEGMKIKKLAKAIDNEGSLKPAVTLIKSKSKRIPCSVGTYRKYRNLAMRNGIMLTPIPKEEKFTELSAMPLFRNYSIWEVGKQYFSYMLPYQSVTESAPELEPVKDMYDAILEFLYGLYDQYVASHNADIEATMIPAEEYFEEE